MCEGAAYMGARNYRDLYLIPRGTPACDFMAARFLTRPARG